MNRPYIQLETKFRQLAQLEHALTFLQWDQQVMMPPKGNDSRAASIAELVALHHKLLTTKETADLIIEAREEETTPEICRSLTEMERTYRQSACLPEDLVKAQSLAGSRCEHGWRKQRMGNDWVGFLANFAEVVNLSRQEAQARQDDGGDTFGTPYDALLDLYCTGDSSDFINQVFLELKEQLPRLLNQVLDHQGQDGVKLQGDFPIDAQLELNKKLMASLGFDFEGGRIDVSMHPFSTGGRGDQRITTRFRQTEFMEALLATAHETGHSSYEGGLPERWDGLPVGQSRNMCIHESQSLLFEKQLFLSKAFLGYFTGQIHAVLPAATSFTAEQIWAASSRVKPSLIRVEADEVTYPLHVILRFEIERDLINGSIEAADIPDLWDEKMSSYLGLSTAGNYRDGCLQDIHWTDGSFGYFPSYTLGALNSAQIFDAIKKAHPDWQELLGGGEVLFVREWLHEKIWLQASTMESQELMKSATGQGTNPVFFLDHLRQRYLSL
ncbi:carboxypeptidase M32 [Desulfopila sp. IMCC35008]|uniref:carboxypeptidase M32 n=1 Tax=Desulfopila sp. IMCC35008 TaxID=2653858 RepID=UPI0013D4FC51|nr:carboxypeptidase M32 [Desulfopila sp. IMCC35008]